MGLFKKKSKAAGSAQQAQTKGSLSLGAVEAKQNGHYGIDKAIELMRTLPSDDSNNPLVVQVVKQTLESLNIDIASIVGDASRKQRSIEAHIAQLAREMAALENDINRRQAKIESLQIAREEITRAKARLLMAQQHRAESESRAEAAAPGAESTTSPDQGEAQPDNAGDEESNDESNAVAS